MNKSLLCFLVRRALKATFVLVPLFGLQLFLVIYRPNDAFIQDIYEITSTVITDFQVCLFSLVGLFWTFYDTCVSTSVIIVRQQQLTSKQLRFNVFNCVSQVSTGLFRKFSSSLPVFIKSLVVLGYEDTNEKIYKPMDGWVDK